MLTCCLLPFRVCHYVHSDFIFSGYLTRLMSFIPTTNQCSLLVVSSRPWNAELADRLSRQLDRPILIISDPCDLTHETVSAINPQWIFVPHWSRLIPESIWSSWPTVIFHMTDLPYGRGGSPLQNLIKLGHDSTMLSALATVLVLMLVRFIFAALES